MNQLLIPLTALSKSFSMDWINKAYIGNSPKDYKKDITISIDDKTAKLKGCFPVEVIEKENVVKISYDIVEGFKEEPKNDVPKYFKEGIENIQVQIDALATSVNLLKEMMSVLIKDKDKDKEETKLEKQLINDILPYQTSKDIAYALRYKDNNLDIYKEILYEKDFFCDECQAFSRFISESIYNAPVIKCVYPHLDDPDPRLLLEIKHALYTCCLKTANNITKDTRRGSGNIIFCNKTLAYDLLSLANSEYHNIAYNDEPNIELIVKCSDPENDEKWGYKIINVKPFKFGDTFKIGRFTVYVTDNVPVNKILMTYINPEGRNNDQGFVVVKNYKGKFAVVDIKDSNLYNGVVEVIRE